MAGGGVGEAALLETVMAAETAGAVAGGAELAGGLGSLVGAGELAGLGGSDLIANAGAGLAGGAGGLSNLTPLLEGEFGTAALNPAVAAQTAQAANVAGQTIPSALEAGSNLYQPGLGQGNNIAQMMGNPGVDFAGGTAQQTLQSAAQAVEPNIGASMANAQAGIDAAGAASPYPTPGGTMPPMDTAAGAAQAQANIDAAGRIGTAANPNIFQQAMKAYGDLPAPLRYGLGAMGAIKAINALDGNKYGTPEKEKYEGPLSRFKYNPDRYTPSVATPNVYRPSYAGGGLADLGGYADYARGGRMLKGPGDGMSDSIPAVIAGKQPARLANDEFVVSADVVSHLGNGSSDAGAKQLYRMMDRVRAARTGKQAQAKQINPNKYMPA